MTAAQDAILGLDIGTSAIKAVLYDPDGRELWVEQRTYPLQMPQPGWVELDPDRLWQALVDAVRSLTSATAGSRRVRSLALAVPAGCMVPVDASGAPLTPIITWLDRRGEELAAAWDADGTAAAIRRQSGWRPQVGMPFATIAWIVRHVPDVAAATVRYAGVHDLLAERLTGRAVTDYSAGGETGLVALAGAAWSDELCSVAGIQRRQLPALVPAGARIGPVLPAICAEMGLPPGTMLAAGGHDQCCAALGMGVTEPGQLMLATGTAWVVTALTEVSSVERIPAQMDLNFHVMPGVRTASQLLGGFGAQVEWLLDVVFATAGEGAAAQRSTRYAAFDRAVAESRPGAGGLHFLPMGASRIGASGGFVGLRLDHRRGDLARALLEGAAYEVRQALDKLSVAGQAISALWMAGGAARSPVWPSILASVTGRPLYLAAAGNWPARGAALLAAAGSRSLPSLPDAVVQWRPALATVLSDHDFDKLYSECYADYLDLVARLDR